MTEKTPAEEALIVAPALDRDEIEVLRGALGLRYATKPYRNRFLAPPSGDTRRACDRLEGLGLMEKGGTETYRGAPGAIYQWFRVTDAGTEAALAAVKQERTT